MPHPIDTHVGKQLRTRRILLGLSQEAVAKVIGITFQQIQKYERRINRMGASRLYEFSKLFTVPVSYFFEGADKDEYSVTGVAEEQAAFEYEQVNSRETLELVRNYHRIPDPNVQKHVADLVRSLAEGKTIIA